MDKKYYLGIRDNQCDNDENVDNFFKYDRFFECLCKPIKKNNLDRYTIVELQIIDIIYFDEFNKNKIGDIISVYDISTFIKNEFMTESPNCNINDGGSINWSGEYRSYFIDVEKYNTLITNIEKLSLIDEIKNLETQIEVLNNTLQSKKDQCCKLADNTKLYNIKK